MNDYHPDAGPCRTCPREARYLVTVDGEAYRLCAVCYRRVVLGR